MLVGTVGDLATTWGDLEILIKCSFGGIQINIHF